MRPDKYNVGLLNKYKVRDYALELSKQVRPQFTRVSPQFIDDLEDLIKMAIREKIVFSETKKRTLK